MYLCSVKIGVIIIVFVFLFRPVLPVLEYVLNYDYIRTVLCENKAKPKLSCNGKCHLMKQLAKASEQEDTSQKNNKSQVKAEWEFPFFQTNVDENSSPFCQMAYPNSIFSYSNLYQFSAVNSVFHPPAV